ncbi:DJ-1/PfpI/YhbO family deglycase/protease [Amnibacterium endophyticum]|uniref:DJ-1/PfpI/YhbO family deglycase/protease n=1 Tax=Amnibacterium endophyticum TaxID=2109337 RepID=A0ABW4LEJ9_9MICO
MAHVDLTGKRVLAIATNYGVEQDEIVVPVEHLRGDGATVDIATADDGAIQTLVDDKEQGREVEATTTLDAIDDLSQYDLLLIPGGSVNADQLRLEEKAVAIAEGFITAGKPVAAICHAPWTLIETGRVKGKRLTSFWSLKTDVRNAGGDWQDSSVVVDDSDGWTLITSRNPKDLDDFVGAIDEALAPA